MIYSCPKCKRMITNDDVVPGQISECPFCGEMHEVPFNKIKKPTVPKTAAANAGKEDTSGTALYFWLGFLFSVVGLLISAVAGKERGLKAALRGFILGVIIMIILTVILGLL